MNNITGFYYNKYMPVLFVFIISAFLLMSCATQAAIIPPETISEISPEMTPELSPEIPPEIKSEVNPAIWPADVFEYALLNIKRNTPLFQRSITNSSYIIPEAGFRNMEDIRVIGEALIEDKEFRVTYNLAGAVLTDNNTFQIPFLLENLTDNVSRHDDLVWHPADDKSGLLLSFDDNYFESWMQYLDIFDNHDAKVTFFVQGDLNADNDDSVFLEIFCRRALSRGHDLGYHTINHPNLTRISIEEFNSETIKAAKVFFNAGIHFNAFGYPYGFSETWMHEILSPVFHITRGYGSNTRYYNSQTIRNGYLVSKAIDNIMYPDNEKFEYDMRLILLLAKFSGDCIVPFTSHDFSDAQWAITPARIEYLLRVTKELNLKFYTFSDIRQIFIQ